MSPKGFFVVGTDTNVGKTVACAWLVGHLKGYYWKPIQTGLRTDSADKDTVRQFSNIPLQNIVPCTYSFQEPLSPHLAASLENVVVSLKDFVVPQVPGPLIIEGAGGVLVPINEQEMIIDLVKECGFPALVVGRSALGTINHTLLTLEALRARRVDIGGVILNGPLNPLNKASIETYGKVKVVAELPFLNPLSSEALFQIPLGGFFETYFT